MGFLRAIWNGITVFRNIVINLIFLLLVVIVIIGFTAGESLTVPDKGALVLNPTGIIVEQAEALDPVAEFLSDNEDPAETELRDVLDAIEEGRTDPRIGALVLGLDGLSGASLSALQEIGDALDAFRDSGKPIYVFGRSFGQSQYYLAAHADELFLDSASLGALGGVLMTGLGSYPTYFNEALEKLDVSLHVFRVGTYKSAVEPYLRNDMSEESKESNRRWLGALWSSYSDDVMARRDLSAEQFDAYTNRLDELLAGTDGDGIRLALDAGLVDDIISREEFQKKVASVVGRNAKGDVSSIGFRDYLAVQRPPFPMPTPGANQIAVITAKGTILDGEHPAGTIGGETLSRLIEDARENSAVKAVVLRIDSPGGSAAASERIRAQLAMTQRAGKPVVVSMSGVAASGGYWVSATANKIFAMPTTITGSIGNFLVLGTFEETLSGIGINTDGVGTTRLSGALDITRSLNPVLERMLELSAQHVYNKFISIVAEGREMTPEQVDEIAQGQVWTGEKAMEIGLVDAMGDLDDAIESAALLADVQNYEILKIEEALTPREQLIREILNSTLAPVKAAFGPALLPYGTIDRMTTELRSIIELTRQPGVVFARCTVCEVRG